MANLTAIILTYNEEVNIELCINSIKHICERIIVIDSYSTDTTVEIARSLGAEIYQNKFVNQSKQFQYGLEVAEIKTTWIMRLDADERLTEESAHELQAQCKKHQNTNINGIVIRFKVNFLGKNLRYGGVYPFRKLLVFKNGMGEIEDRSMDEHIFLKSGKSIELENDSLHYDFKDLTYWIHKHNNYSSREIIDYIESKNKPEDMVNLERRAKVIRFIKFKIYYNLPLGTRAHLYFIYRYYFKLGFLDGKEGKIYAFMQAYWYRFLVDAKIYEKAKLDNKLLNKKIDKDFLNE